MEGLPSFQTPEGSVSEYAYVDHSKEGEPVLFRCSAETLEEADAMFKDATGIDPETNVYIGRVIESAVNEEWFNEQQ